MLSMRFLLITLRESQIDSWFSKRDSSAYTKCLKLWAEWTILRQYRREKEGGDRPLEPENTWRRRAGTRGRLRRNDRWSRGRTRDQRATWGPRKGFREDRVSCPECTPGLRMTRADHTCIWPDVGHQQGSSRMVRWAPTSGIPSGWHPLVLAKGTTGRPSHQSKNRHGNKLEKWM